MAFISKLQLSPRLFSLIAAVVAVLIGMFSWQICTALAAAKTSPQSAPLEKQGSGEGAQAFDLLVESQKAPRCPDVAPFSPFDPQQVKEPINISCLVVREFESARSRAIARFEIVGGDGQLCCAWDISPIVMEIFPLGTPKDKIMSALSDRFKFRRGGFVALRRLPSPPGLSPPKYTPAPFPDAPKPDAYDEAECGYYMYHPIQSREFEASRYRVCFFLKNDLLVDLRADGQWN